MTSRSASAAGLLFGVPIALGFTIGLAFAQDGATSIRKTPLATGTAGSDTAPESALRPSIGKDVLPPGSGAPVGEIVPSSLDEGASWEAAVEAANAPTPLIGAEQKAAVARINAYFNAMTNLQGRFEQFDPSNKRTTGRFYVQRPGKIRFDYAPPSALRIVADGHSLAIEDSDLKTVEKYPIKSTPFRLLLGDSVDLGRDAHIVGVEIQNDELAISLEDRGGGARGSIKLSFYSNDGLKLKEWMITDAQGLSTRVIVNNVVAGRKVAIDFFQSKDKFSPFQ
ncbi:MAG: outer membrane lipoprotein carrier protein LolA [Hyphomicrobiaceae bacterium]|jgi:outer membrane lipoprotein-sorting protein|nr:outer-membrane lipoprotein carrier protein LolA [Methyloceanibacter sp.]MDX2317146.1 outer membrane lipoprotein carrier protein LolA [Hyphomicrobiaceae bacterium]MDX2449163.1 outer membrane lipoprotein carrier protein LolA [Hyphomicrobiaceae bacterium]